MLNHSLKDCKWSWGEDEQQAFDEIKCCVTSSPILYFADDSKPFHIEAVITCTNPPTSMNFSWTSSDV